MNYQDINAATIDRWVEEGLEWGTPICHETNTQAVQGNWDVLLTPAKPVPHEWFGSLFAAGLVVFQKTCYFPFDVVLYEHFIHNHNRHTGGNMDSLLSQDDTKTLKGLAIIMMLTHHLWAFPDRIAGGELKHLFSIFGTSSTIYLGWFGKICVSLFFFLSGYGLYISCHEKQFDLIGKIKKLYTSYWKVFLVFIPIAFLFFTNQPTYCENASICTKYASFTWETWFLNFTGISSSYNSEWWFLISYIFAMISFPFIRGIVNRHSVRGNLAIVVSVSLLICNIFPALGKSEVFGNLNNNYLYNALLCQAAPFSACFWMGIVVAKSGLLCRIKESLAANNLLNPAVDIVSLGSIVLLRQSATGDVLDIFYVPFLIVFFLDLIDRVAILKRFFLEIGKQSTPMWLIHSFFCYYFYGIVNIVVSTRWAIPSLIILIVITYAASIALNYFWKMVGSAACCLRKLQMHT